MGNLHFFFRLLPMDLTLNSLLILILIVILKLIKSQTESGNDIFKPITVAVMNCQSIKNKKPVFNIFIDEHQPNIIIGSESWISPAVHSSELFLANYNVYRKDREGAWLWRGIHFVHQEAV